MLGIYCQQAILYNITRIQITLILLNKSSQPVLAILQYLKSSVWYTTISRFTITCKITRCQSVYMTNTDYNSLIVSASTLHISGK